MFGGVYAIGEILLTHPLVTLCVQVLIGAVIYLGVSVLFKMKPFLIVLDTVKGILKKKKSAVS